MMISIDYCNVMARYNVWQNRSLVRAADGLGDAARWRDRGAFFKSIAATLNHLVWADALILERLKGNERPQDHVTHSLDAPRDWGAYKALRAHRDAEILAWAGDLTAEDMQRVVRWVPLDGGDRVEMAFGLKAMTLFNHQTHHRGQIHGMLTAAGASPEPTDLPLMPADVGVDA